ASNFYTPQNAFYSPTSQQQSFPPGGMDFLSNPLVNVATQMAGQYTSMMAQKGQELLPNEVKRSITSVKYYFAVDTKYVIKKLCLLLFPFRPRNWSLQYSADEPVPPRVDSNAPDYYIPLMSALTYVLIAGLALGTQNKFSPEQLGFHSSSVLVWFIIEVGLLCLIFYIFGIQTKLRTLDLIAYCGYKYVGMISAVSAYLLTNSLLAYRCVLIYISVALSYFLVKSLRLQILPETGSHSTYGGSKRRIYLLLAIVLLQPFFIWYLTRHLIA
ncbi:unnamed protein product, partial [Didymodactylos carnosus]